MCVVGGGSLIKLHLYFVQQIVHITPLRGDDLLSESQENKVVISETEAEATAGRCHGYLDEAAKDQCFPIKSPLEFFGTQES